MSPNLQPPEKDNLDKPRTAPPGQTMRQAALETALQFARYRRAVMTMASHAGKGTELKSRVPVAGCQNAGFFIGGFTSHVPLTEKRSFPYPFTEGIEFEERCLVEVFKEIRGGWFVAGDLVFYVNFQLSP